MTEEQDLLSRNPVMAVSRAGIAVQVNGRDEVRPWHRVTSVGATIVGHGEAQIFVAAIAFDDVRTFVIGEVEPAWLQLVGLLHVCLSGVEPFDIWGPRLLAEPGVTSLFERDAV